MSMDAKAAKAIQDIVDQRIRSDGANRASTHMAEVVEVDKQGTVWVHIFGGAERTPATKALAHVEKGDLVTATIEDGSVTITGSPSSPAASQRQVEKVASIADAASANALEHAAEAAEAAAVARSYANVANDAANTALTGLSIVEDVAGTLDWISKHGTYTASSDTQVDDSKVYFEYDQSTDDYTPVVSPDPTANPSTEGWYVLDVTDSQSAFIMAHLAVTSRGLWVLPSGVGSSTTPAQGESQADSDARQGDDCKVLLSSDGMYVYDDDGVLVAFYGATAIIGKSSGNHIAVGTGGVAIMDGSDEIAGFGSTVHIGKVANSSRYLSIDSNGNGEFHGAKLDIFEYPYTPASDATYGTIRHHYVKVANYPQNSTKLHAISLYASSSDTKIGLYDEANSCWVLYADYLSDPGGTYQRIYLPGRIFLANGTQIWDNTSQITHLLTPVNSSNKRAEFTFEPDGKIYRRTSTNGGTSWSSWTSIAG